jgi:hypothetical protein
MRRTGIRHALLGLLSVVAAGTVGFAVGDALATPAQKAATTVGTARQDAGVDFEWAWDLAPGKTLEIKGVNGSIHAVRAASGRAEVTAVKRARRSDPDDVTIEVVKHAGGVTICALYPSPRFGPKNDCQPGSAGRGSMRNNDVQVEFTVRVPAGVRFVARTVNGEVDAEALDGPVEAVTVNGSIRVSTRRSVTASTVNGSIRAGIGALGADDLEFSTVNGSITLELPENANAHVHASTVNGDIESEFPLTVQGRISRRRLDGTLGSGGPGIRAETVNGGIRLRQRETSM